MKTKCNLGTDKWGDQCCCICKMHLKLMSHPEVDGKGMSNQDGWICLAFAASDGIAVKINEHGLCEAFIPKDTPTSHNEWNKLAIKRMEEEEDRHNRSRY